MKRKLISKKKYNTLSRTMFNLRKTRPAVKVPALNNLSETLTERQLSRPNLGKSQLSRKKNMKNFRVRRSDVLRYKDLKIYDFFHLTCFILYSEDLFQFSLLVWILCHRTRKCIKYGKLTKKTVENKNIANRQLEKAMN